jgi:hypothetical protein
MFSAMILSLGLAHAPAPQQHSQPAVRTEAAATAQEPIICRTVDLAGSRVRGPRVCATAREFREAAEQRREEQSTAVGQRGPIN